MHTGLISLAAVTLALEPLPAPTNASAPLTAPRPALTDRARIAVVTPDGTVAVSQDEGLTWTPIHQCTTDGETEGETLALDEFSTGPEWLSDSADPTTETSDGAGPPCGDQALPAAITWHRDALYIACIDGPLAVWTADRARSTRVVSAPSLRVIALGAQSGPKARLLLGDADGALWSSRDGHRFEHLARVPGRLNSATGPPSMAITTFAEDIIVALPGAIWRLHGIWRPLLAVSACALASSPASHRWPATLWVAGPDGLLELIDGDLSRDRTRGTPRVRVRSIAPATGVAWSAGQLIAVNGRQVTILHGSRVRDATGKPGPTSGAADSVQTVTHLTRNPLLYGLPLGARAEVWFQRRIRALQRRRRWAQWLPDVSAGASVNRVYRLDNAMQGRKQIEIWLWLSWTLSKDGSP